MDKKWKRILMTIYILVLVVMLSTATFTYFSIIRVTTVKPVVQTTTAVTDWLSFNTGDAINIYATEENFGQGMGDIIGSSYGSVLLRVSNEGTEATYNYNITLNIEDNNFVYTTDTLDAELLLVVHDPEGNEVRDIPGLQYVSVVNGNGEELHGFDVTTATGTYYIANNYAITSNLQEQHIWDVDLILVNLGSDQQENTDKSIDAYLEVSAAQ